MYSIKTQADAVKYFIKQLDIDMIDDILVKDRTYQDFSKPIFISKLQEAFNQFKEGGDTFLHMFGGHCNSKICNYKCTGYKYVGNNSNNYFDLIIEEENGEVKDIYECTSFKCKINIEHLQERIEIDNFDWLEDGFDIDFDD